MALSDTFSEVVERVSTLVGETDEIGLLMALIIVAVVFWFRKVLANMVLAAINKLMKRLSVGLPDEALEELKAPTSTLIVTLAIFFAADFLNLPEITGGFIRRVLASAAIIAAFSAWYNLAGPFVALLSGEKSMDLEVEKGWMERVTQFGIVLFGITALLRVWQVDISGALTGVGVLGAGLAIATQDLIRNLIAGMNNQSEKRFSVGDTVEIDGAFIGSVEQIDLRSTLVRGFDQIPRYVPNAELSNAVVMNYSQRRHIRVLHTFGYVLGLSDTQVQKILAALTEYFEASGDFDTAEGAPKYICVQGVSDSAIEIMFYGRTTNGDYRNYLDVNQRLILKVLEISKDLNAPIAYPTRTLEVLPKPISLQGSEL